MQRLNLQELTRRGRLGPIVLGMQDDVVRQALGEPDDIGGISRKYRRGNLWLFGDLELGFEPKLRQLLHLSINFAGGRLDRPTGGPAMELDPWVFHGGLSPDAYTTALNGAGIAFQRSHPDGSNGDIWVHTEALAIFGPETNGDGEPLLSKLTVPCPRYSDTR